MLELPPLLLLAIAAAYLYYHSYTVLWFIAFAGIGLGIIITACSIALLSE